MWKVCLGVERQKRKINQIRIAQNTVHRFLLVRLSCMRFQNIALLFPFYATIRYKRELSNMSE